MTPLCAVLLACFVFLEKLVAADDSTDWAPWGDNFQDLHPLVRTVSLSSQNGRRVAVYHYQEVDGARDQWISCYEYNSTNEVWEALGDGPIIFSRSDNVGLEMMRFSGDGNHIMVGLRDFSISDKIVGTVMVYRLNTENTSWTPMGTNITLPQDDLSPLIANLTLENNLRYPSRIDIANNGARVVVSYAPEIRYLGNVLTSQQLLGIGRVWIYEYDANSDAWKRVGQVLQDTDSPWFGGSVHLSGDGSRVAILRAQYFENEEGRQQMRRAFRVFEQTDPTVSSSPWEPLGVETLPDYSDVASLSYSGNFLALGSFCIETDILVTDICVGQNPAAFVLQYNTGNNQWDQVGQTLSVDIAWDITYEGQVFLSMEGSRLALGFRGRQDMPREWVNSEEIGTYFLDSTDMWVQDSNFTDLLNTTKVGRLQGFSANGLQAVVDYQVYGRSSNFVGTGSIISPVVSTGPTSSPSESTLMGPSRAMKTGWSVLSLIFNLI